MGYVGIYKRGYVGIHRDYVGILPQQWRIKLIGRNLEHKTESVVYAELCCLPVVSKGRMNGSVW